MLLYIEKVRTNRSAFENKVREIAAKLGFDPNWLMLVMWVECRLDHTRVNPYNGASGLIQFLRKTAKSLGTSVEEIRKMNNIQQLTLVERFLSPYKGKIKSFLDLYLAVFFPLHIGKPLNTVVESKNLSAGLIASQNPAYDFNKDGKITLAEIAKALMSHVPTTFNDVVEVIKKKSSPEESLS